jgi:hypothetical protein
MKKRFTNYAQQPEPIPTTNNVMRRRTFVFQNEPIKATIQPHVIEGPGEGNIAKGLR